MCIITDKDLRNGFFAGNTCVESILTYNLMKKRTQEHACVDLKLQNQ
jgi:hypothetical protein